MNKWIKYLAGIMLVCSVAYAADTVFNTDILTFGRPSAGNKTLKFRQSNASSQPGFRFNSSTSKMEYSNDGVGYAEFNAEPSMALPFINVGWNTSGWNGGQLTVNLKQADGTTDCGVGAAACKIAFSKKPTFGYIDANTTYVVKEITTTPSYTTGVGTFFGDGTGSSSPAYYYVYAYVAGNLAGGVSLAMSKTLYDEGFTYNITLDSGGGQDPRQIYGPSSCSGCVIRVIGRMIVDTAGGTWNANGNVRLMLPPFSESIRDIGVPVVQDGGIALNTKPQVVFTTVRCQASPTYSNDPYGLVSSITRIGGGTCRINWKYSFGAVPVCTCVQRNNSGNRFCLTQAVNVADVQYVLSQDGGGAVDGVDVDMICIGRN